MAALASASPSLATSSEDSSLEASSISSPFFNFLERFSFFAAAPFPPLKRFLAGAASSPSPLVVLAPEDLPKPALRIVGEMSQM